jgi:hypothetical protein
VKRGGPAARREGTAAGDPADEPRPLALAALPALSSTVPFEQIEQSAVKRLWRQNSEFTLTRA